MALTITGINFVLGANTAALNRARRDLGRFNRRIKTSAKGTEDFTFRMRELSKSVQIALGPLSGIAARLNAFTGLLNLGTAQLAIFVGGFIALVAGMSKAVLVAGDFEEGLVGVGKTTNLAGAQLQELGDQIVELSKDLATGSDELLKIAQAAGQVGVRGTSNLLAFTETMAKLAVATDLVGDQAVRDLARLLNITGEAPSNIATLGSVITRLGNEFAATESEINRVAVRVGQATAAFNVSSGEAEALGAALASIGARAEESRGVIGRSFRAIDAAIRGGGDELRVLSQLTRITGKDLEKTFKEAPVEVFRAFIEGLGGVIAAGGTAADVLDVFGVAGERDLALLPTLAQNVDILTAALKAQADEVENATALNTEFGKQIETFNSQMKIFGELLSAIGKTIGDELLPAATSIIVSFNEFLDSTESISLAIEVLATAFTSLLIFKTVGLLIKGFAALMGVATAGVGFFVISLRILRAVIRTLFGPIGLVILAGEALLLWSRETDTAAVRQREFNKELKKMEKITKDLKTATEEQTEALRTQRDVAIQGAIDRVAALELLLESFIKVPQEIIDVLGPEAAAALFLPDIMGTELVTAQLKEVKNELILLLNAAGIGARKARGATEGPRKLPFRLDIDLPGTESAEDRKARKTQDNLKRTIELIERENEATLAGELALARFNAQIKIEETIRKSIQKLTKFERETEEEFLQRRINLEAQLNDALRQQEELRQEAGLKELQERIDLTEREIVAMEAGTTAFKAFKLERESEEFAEQLEDEIKLLGLEEEAAQKLIDSTKELAERRRVAQEQLEKQEEQLKELEKIVDRLGDTFGRAFEDAIIEGKGFKEILKTVIDEINRMIIRLLVIEPILKNIKKAMEAQVDTSSSSGGLFGTLLNFLPAIIGGFAGGGLGPQFTGTGTTGLLSSGSFAKGGVFNNRRITKRLQQGGIVNQPTAFGDALIGEAGPEAVLPLVRTATGELGVKTQSDSGGRPVVIIEMRNDFRGASLEAVALLQNNMERLRQEIIAIIQNDQLRAGSLARLPRV